VETRGVLRLAGKGGRDFLHRICTQHVKALPPGGSAYAAFLDNHGHVVGEGLVAAHGDDLLLVTEPAEVPILLPHLRKYVLAAPVRIDDVSGEISTLAVLGPKGVEAARAAAGLTVAATPRRGVPAVEVAGPRESLEALRTSLLASGAADLSAEDLEVLRIEEGVARFGADLDGERLPMEAGLSRDAIHFDKGCYIGQETVTRASFRGQIQRGLVQLELPPGAGPGTPLSADGKEVGQVTSAAETTRGRLGLGYVRRAHWREGERLATPAGDAIVRRVLVHEPAGGPPRKPLLSASR
jgi:hypothetical protein